LRVRAVAPAASSAEEAHGKLKWVASWAASAHGRIRQGRSGAARSQLRLRVAGSRANEQTFRLVLRPDSGQYVRLRFTNVFGVQPLALDDLYLGLQEAAARSSRQQPADHVCGRGSVTIPAGQVV